MRVFAGVIACVAISRAQTAQISGRVTDATGATVPGAEISTTNGATGAVRQAKSNDLGLYTISLLPPGLYHVTVERDGFRSLANRHRARH